MSSDSGRVREERGWALVVAAGSPLESPTLGDAGTERKGDLTEENKRNLFYIRSPCYFTG
jgi:hypothetical protein